MSFLVESSIWIDCGRDELFRVITTPSNFASFMPGVTEAVFLDDNKGVGAQIQFKWSMFGMTARIVAEWTQYDPPTSFGFSNIAGPIETTALTTLIDESGGTRLERVSTIKPMGVFGNLALPMAKRTTERNQNQEFEALRDLIEAKAIGF